jgi:hypothetical protein
LLLSHWHCIVPVVAIAVVLLLRGRSGKRTGKNDADTGVIDK